tara:strand:- start:881 stop:1540 length:660 start_codon:yes stop_codon:yes gene_type:complete
MSNDAKSVGADFAKDLATGVANKAIDKITGTSGSGSSGGLPSSGPTQITKLNDPSLQSQVALMDIQNKQTQLNMETAAELDRVQREFYTTQDIRRDQSTASENRLGTMVGAEEQRKSARVAGQEQRAGYAEQGAQARASARVGGQERRAELAEGGAQTRASARVAGEEQRAGFAEGGSQARATKRVEGQEVRETDLQREMFRRYKEARDYGQAQQAYKA